MAVPWTRLAFLVPTALGLARELLARKPPPRGGEPKDLEPRLAALEETQRKEAEVVHALAEQASAVAEAAGELRRQARFTLWVAIGSAVLAGAALLAALLR
jgi:hypothetical protein